MANQGGQLLFHVTLKARRNYILCFWSTFWRLSRKEHNSFSFFKEALTPCTYFPIFKIFYFFFVFRYITKDDAILPEMDSRICTVEVKPSKDGDTGVGDCHIDEELLRENPIQSYFRHVKSEHAEIQHSRRSLQEFQLEEEPTFMVR